MNGNSNEVECSLESPSEKRPAPTKGILSDCSESPLYLLISPIMHRGTVEDSSSDDTSDEAYHRRHLPYELQEQNASMRVYQNASVGNDQDLSGMSYFEDSGSCQSPALQSSLNIFCSEDSLSHRNRLAAQNLILAEATTCVVDQGEESRIHLDSNVILHLETSSSSPTCDNYR
jgi:hypothetical protein